jgi:cytochrome c peroxidase
MRHAVIVLLSLAVACGDTPTGGAPETADPLTTADAPVLPESPYVYGIPVLPAAVANDPATVVSLPADNPITAAGAALGRVLFYDRRLSRDGTVSCASCHVQSAAFTDTARVSRGVAGAQGTRNSMAVVNLAFTVRAPVTPPGAPVPPPGAAPTTRFFWDTRAMTLEEQLLAAIQNDKEMAMPLDTLVARLSAVSWYPVLFERAFGSRTITSDRIAQAIGQFERSMVSVRSRHDSAQAVGFTTFTPQEQLGRQLFNDPTRIPCGACHGTAPNFVNAVPHNIGLDATTTDRGVGAISGLRQDDGKFRVSSLRNVAVTGPYMHDGRFASLEQVIRFYSRQVQPHPNLGPQLRNPDGSPRRPSYTDAEVAALVAYLRTLTDQTFLTDVRFSTPFRR